MTDVEKQAAVESFIKERWFRISNLERLYGENGSSRIHQNRTEITFAREYGYEYVRDPDGYWLDRTQVRTDPTPRLVVVSATEQILKLLRTDERYLYQLGPERFELFVCERLERMGFSVQRIGSTNTPDGGVDIIACSTQDAAFPFLLAVQVKYHRDPLRRIGPGPVKDLQAVVAMHPFQAGVLVTNTTFTPNARWFAHHRPHMVRLRDCDDLKRWIWNDFVVNQAAGDLPATIQLRPGLVIRVKL